MNTLRRIYGVWYANDCAEETLEKAIKALN